jgi:hypothetical protein
LRPGRANHYERQDQRQRAVRRGSRGHSFPPLAFSSAIDVADVRRQTVHALFRKCGTAAPSVKCRIPQVTVAERKTASEASRGSQPETPPIRFTVVEALQADCPRTVDSTRTTLPTDDSRTGMTPSRSPTPPTHPGVYRPSSPKRRSCWRQGCKHGRAITKWY